VLTENFAITNPQGEDSMHILKVITTLLALCAGGCASLESPQALVSVPDKLKPGANEALSAVVPAKGVQIYECRASKEQQGTYAWAFVAPEADLFDKYGKRIGRHYAGPHWEAVDGSKVVGALKERADAPAGDAIPWLLLAAKSVGQEGAFRKVTSIQRVNTAGGLAPLSGCSNAAIGTTARIHYTADYYFFAAK
jgi:hypothetical protein